MGGPAAGVGAGLATAAGAGRGPGLVGRRSVHPGRIRAGSVKVRPSDMTDPLLACQTASHAPAAPYSRWAILLSVSPGATMYATCSGTSQAAGRRSTVPGWMRAGCSTALRSAMSRQYKGLPHSAAAIDHRD